MSPKILEESRREFVRKASASIAFLGSCTSLLGAEKAKPTIGVSVLTLTNPFFRSLADGITAEAEKNGMRTIITSGEFDVAKQRNQVADFLVQRVDAIILCPCDSKAIGTAIQEANAKGVPVFTADIASLAPGAKVVAHVATDNFGGGKSAAQAIAESVKVGKVAILDFPEVESVILRTKGFREEVERLNRKQGIKIEVVATLPGSGAKDKSMKATEDLLQSHPDLKGIFAINDPSALGAVAALEKAGKLADVKVVGFDGMPEGKAAIKAGKIYGDPIQFPDKIGRETVRAVVKYLNGEEVKPELLIPTKLYRQAEALKDPDLK